MHFWSFQKILMSTLSDIALRERPKSNEEILRKRVTNGRMNGRTVKGVNSTFLGISFDRNKSLHCNGSLKKNHIFRQFLSSWALTGVFQIDREIIFSLIYGATCYITNEPIGPLFEDLLSFIHSRMF